MAMTTEIGPLVSILIPCFNAEKWVADAIRSALAQTYPHKEVILVDDGSTDRSLEVAKSFGEAVRWETGPNQGASAARNRLLALSRGEWLQYLDADDCLLPRKIETHMALVAAVPCDLVVGPWVGDGKDASTPPPSHDPWTDLLSGLGHLGNSSENLWRKQSIVAAGGWDPSVRLGEELELMFAMLRGGARVAYCSEPMVTVRDVNSDSLSHQDPLGAPRISITHLKHRVAFLQCNGQLNLQRRRAAAMNALRIAEALWRARDTAWTEAESLARTVCPDLAAFLRRETHVYGILYGLFGFRWARRYLGLTRVARSTISQIRRLLWPRNGPRHAISVCGIGRTGRAPHEHEGAPR